jgi:hypothetical protein
MTARSSWYVPTARPNVVGMLTAGLVMPAVGLPKYYEDLLALAPSRLVLSSHGANRDWFTTNGTPGGKPALIEVDVMPAGEELRHGNVTVAAPATAIPISRVLRIHLPTERQAEEFLARRYDNFAPEKSLVAASPDLFGVDEAPNRAEIATWLASLDRPAHPTVEDIEAADRLGGAVTMLVASPALSADDVRARRAVLDRLASPQPDPAIAEFVADALAAPEWLSADPEPDRQLLRACVDVLARLTPTARLGARRVIADIQREVVGSNDEVESNLRRVESVLKGRSELRPLVPDAGLRSAKSLLLFLLRQAPEDVVTWSADMPSDPLAVVGASVLAGFTAGGRRVPTSLRRLELSPIVSCVLADRINAGLDAAESYLDPIELTVRSQEVDGGRSESLCINDHEVLSFTEPSATTEESQPELFTDVTAADEPPPDGSTAGRAMAEGLADADFDSVEVARASAAVCIRFGWDDLVETVVRVPDRGFTVRGGEVTFVGTPTITRRIDKATFVQRISELPDLSAPELDILREVTKRPGRRPKGGRGKA